MAQCGVDRDGGSETDPGGHQEYVNTLVRCLLDSFSQERY